MLSVLAESVETGDEIIFANAAFCDESFVFTRLTYKHVQDFRNEPLHESYGLKASQMSKIHATVVLTNTCMLKKSRIFVNRISKVRQTTSNWIARILNKAT